MLRWLIHASLQRPSIVLLLAGLLLGGAGWLLPNLPLDVFPELNAPTVVVMTEAPGFAADEVEQYVTFPIESAVNGLPGVRRVRTSSTTGLSIAWVEFEWGDDLYRARQLVSERLQAAIESLPENTHAEITPISSIMGEVMLLALSSPDGSVSGLDLRAYAEFELRNRLLSVPGVAQVVALGGELPEYQVQVKSEELAAQGLTFDDIAEAAKQSHATAGGGYLEDVDRRELPIRQMAKVQNVDDIRSTLIELRDGAPLKIGDVAEVRLAGAPRRGTAADHGVTAVVLSVQKSPGANTLTLTGEIDRSLDELVSTLNPGMKLNRLVFRQADFIKRAVDNVIVVMRDAAIIVAIILILFLLNVRTTIITLTALPLSFAAALVILKWLGLSINVMTLGGLAVAIGELVDDAIIDVENVFRRLKENAQLPLEQRRPHTRVIFDASNEVRSAVVFATILIIIVFAPMMFLEGIEGRFFRPLGITYVVSILASLFVALTVTPAMCKFLLKGKLGREHGNHDSPLVRFLKRGYEPALRWSMHHRKSVLAGALALTILAFGLGSTYGTSFLPSFNEGTLTVFFFTPPGTSLAESDRVARGIESRFVTIPGVRSVTRRTGRAERDEHAEPPSNSEVEVTVEEGGDMVEIRRRIDAILAEVPGITTTIGQPIEHRLSHILSGTPAAVAINIYSNDLTTLRQAAAAVEKKLKAIPGTRDVIAGREVESETAPVQYRHGDLAVAGLTPAEAARQVQQAWYGAKVAEVNQGIRRFDLAVRLHPDERESIADLRQFRLHGKSGASVRLQEVADVGLARTSNLIARENARRKSVVSCNVAEGANLGDLVQRIRAELSPVISELGCTFSLGGQFEAQEAATKTLSIYGAAVLVVMLLLLQISAGSLRVAALVMLNLPLALIGGIVAVFLAESKQPIHNFLALFGGGSGDYIAPVLSLSSLVGFITLFGIAVRNGILLVNHYTHVMEVEGKPMEEAVVQGSLERLVPILMTALSAALGLIPLAMAAGKPGSELLAPLSVVVLGGLVSATFLNLFVIPAGYLWVHPRRRVSHSQGVPS